MTSFSSSSALLNRKEKSTRALIEQTKAGRSRWKAEPILNCQEFGVIVNIIVVNVVGIIFFVMRKTRAIFN